MERKKLTRSRRSYYDDYKKTASGEYIYAGPEYEFISKVGKTRKRWMLEMMLMHIAAFVAVMVPGFLRVPGLNYCAYIVLPYTAGILIFGYLLLILGRLAAAKDSVKAWEYDKSVKPLPIATAIAALISAAEIVCEIMFLAANGAGGRTFDAIIFIVCHAVAVVLTVFSLKAVKCVEWKKNTPEQP